MFLPEWEENEDVQGVVQDSVEVLAQESHSGRLDEPERIHGETGTTSIPIVTEGFSGETGEASIPVTPGKSVTSKALPVIPSLRRSNRVGHRPGWLDDYVSA